MLLEPGVGFNVFDGPGATFMWSWDSTLAADEYFQVQLIGPGGEHRGIHTPTKEYSLTVNRFLYKLVTDWYSVRQMAESRWVVVVVRWDGQDPSRIGEVLVESDPRDLTL